MIQGDIRPIAFYLPQFHPIPENDKWWGKGFTEWTNVTKAKPLFEGHRQPRLPADLGFYDLRVPETRIAQADLAQQYGVYGFCYWHYWFAGKRLIERPFVDMVKSGQPDFPFCIAWANQTWEGTWHGLSNNETLIEQTYPGKDDHTSHFYSLLNAFSDKRYIEVNRKKLVFIFNPHEFTDSKEFIEIWQNLAIKEGFNGFHFVAMHVDSNWEYAKYGYDAIAQKWPVPQKLKGKADIKLKSFNLFRLKTSPKVKKTQPLIIPYRNYLDNYPDPPSHHKEYPVVYSDWDNTPRSGSNGWLFEGSTPELFSALCKKAFQETENKERDEKIVLIKSWNEWAEGNYLEPDNRFGRDYLEFFKRALDDYINAKKF